MYVSKNMAATATLVVANGPAELGIININTGATSAVLTVYNNASAGSGTKIATIDASAANSFVFGVRCHLGITVVLSGGNADVTVCYA
jgi:hypothetical protein